jgi:hypothetical protein
MTSGGIGEATVANSSHAMLVSLVVESVPLDSVLVDSVPVSVELLDSDPLDSDPLDSDPLDSDPLESVEPSTLLDSLDELSDPLVAVIVLVSVALV